MTTRARSVCSHPGCPEVTEDGTCLVHRKERPQDTRPSAAARGYGKKWADYSKRYRTEHPLCRQCQAEGLRGATDLVDHIVPVTGPSDPLFWKSTNHQPLCRSHHSVKTRAEGRTQQDTPLPPPFYFV